MSAGPDPWEEARRRTREQVQEVFAQHAPRATERVCAFCGHHAVTHWEHCSACGRSYFDRPPRLSRRARRGLLAGGGVALAALAAWAIPGLVDFSDKNAAATRRSGAAFVAAERARMKAEQRPHHRSAVSLRPAKGAGAAARVQARRQLVDRLERSITTDARTRVQQGLLSGSVPSHTDCLPLVRNQRAGDQDDLSKTTGRWSCVAVQRDVTRAGKRLGLFGLPFVASADFERFTYVWCKDNPAANASETGPTFVRLSRACLASKGRAFGTGYLETP